MLTSLNNLITFTGVVIVTIYLLVAVSALVCRVRERGARHAFRMPWWPLPPLVAIAGGDAFGAALGRLVVLAIGDRIGRVLLLDDAGWVVMRIDVSRAVGELLGAGVVRVAQVGGHVAGEPAPDVGQRLAEIVARRQSEEMRLALGLGDADQLGIGNTRLLEHRLGDGHIVAAGEPGDDTDRRIGNRGEPAREFRQRLGLDFLDQIADDVVEDGDMLVVESGGAVEKQAGDAAQGFRPLLGRAVLDDIFQLGEQGGGGTHTALASPDGNGRDRGFR